MLGTHRVDPNQPHRLTEIQMLENIIATLREENAHLLKSYNELFNQSFTKDSLQYSKLMEERERWMSIAYKYKNELSKIQRSPQTWTRECPCCQLTIHAYATLWAQCPKCGLFLSRG